MMAKKLICDVCMKEVPTLFNLQPELDFRFRQRNVNSIGLAKEFCSNCIKELEAMMDQLLPAIKILYEKKIQELRKGVE